ncbi:MAG: CHAP domain-containing protein, partial [Myxococcaceae bacterium]
ARAQVVSLARGLVGKPKVVVGGRTWPSDCTGLVRAAFSSLGMDLLDAARAGDNSVTAIYRFARERGRVFEAGRPMPGDLVFFRETYDLNRDGRLNDGLTHIGIVEDVDAEGTVTVIHRVARGVVRYRMNLANPDVRRDPATGRVFNDALRHAGPGRSEVLTGQLFAGYATLLSPAESLARR